MACGREVGGASKVYCKRLVEVRADVATADPIEDLLSDGNVQDVAGGVGRARCIIDRGQALPPLGEEGRSKAA